MIDLFKARVQGSRDYIAGISKCFYPYETEEVDQWQIGWDIQQQLHSLSAAKNQIVKVIKPALKAIIVNQNAALLARSCIRDLLC